jgi:hypothetical protein
MVNAQDAIAKIRLDLIRIGIRAQLYGTLESALPALAVHRVTRRARLFTANGEHVDIERYTDVLLLHAGQFRDDLDLLIAFAELDIRPAEIAAKRAAKR